VVVSVVFFHGHLLVQSNRQTSTSPRFNLVCLLFWSCNRHILSEINPWSIRIAWMERQSSKLCFLSAISIDTTRVMITQSVGTAHNSYHKQNVPGDQITIRPHEDLTEGMKWGTSHVSMPSFPMSTRAAALLGRNRVIGNRKGYCGMTLLSWKHWWR